MPLLSDECRIVSEELPENALRGNKAAHGAQHIKDRLVSRPDRTL